QDAQASLHTGALLGGASHSPRRAARGDHPARGGAEPTPPADGVPLPPALPSRDGAVRSRGASAPLGGGAPHRLPPVRHGVLTARKTIPEEPPHGRLRYPILSAPFR